MDGIPLHDYHDDLDTPPHDEPVPCYHCTLEAGGDPRAADGHPLRDIVSTSTQPVTHPEDEAFEVLLLSCGHSII